MQKNVFSLTIFHFPIFKIHFFKVSLVMDSAFFCRMRYNKTEIAALKNKILHHDSHRRGTAAHCGRR
ncbi:MAG: hypothetical protein J5792_05470, partial [Bacteroidales bacterium]|nr:hypothetical protein [Bacteroidales bacterium]